MTILCTAPRQGHRPGSVAERMCPKHGKWARREVLPVAVAALFSSNEPTVMERYDDGTVKREEWLVDGKYHRTDGPALVQYRPDGSVEYEMWFVDDKCHRADGPALVQYRPDGTVELEEWYADGKCRRADGPAVVWYRPDGTIESEDWWVDGKLHRTDGPAVVCYRPDGTVGREEWHVGGRRVDAPAVLAAFLRSRFPHITTGAATLLCEARPWQEWGDISDAEVESAMTLFADFAEA